MLTRRLNGVEQLERKDLFAGLVDAPQLSLAGGALDGDFQTSFAGTILSDCFTGSVLDGV